MMNLKRTRDEERVSQIWREEIEIINSEALEGLTLFTMVFQ